MGKKYTSDGVQRKAIVPKFGGKLEKSQSLHKFYKDWLSSLDGQYYGQHSQIAFDGLVSALLH